MPRLTFLFVAVMSSFMALSTQGWAAGTFNFIKWSADGTEPIFAVMELSGSSPYDHTSVTSLTFAIEAEEVLGYVGPYIGDLDTTVGLNRVIENSNHVLGATSVDPFNLGALFRDTDPPVPVDDPLKLRISKPARLSLFFLVHKIRFRTLPMA